MAAGGRNSRLLLRASIESIGVEEEAVGDLPAVLARCACRTEPQRDARDDRKGVDHVAASVKGRWVTRADDAHGVRALVEFDEHCGREVIPLPEMEDVLVDASGDRDEVGLAGRILPEGADHPGGLGDSVDPLARDIAEDEAGASMIEHPVVEVSADLGCVCRRAVPGRDLGVTDDTRNERQ